MPAREVIYTHIHRHRRETGFDMPELLEYYLVDMLTERLDRCDIIPEPTFAERYLRLYKETRLSEFKDFADSALFFVSLMPEYGRRRGLDMSYYATLGISTYYTLADLSEDPRYTQLGNWFYHLQKFLGSAIRPGTGLELWRF